MEPVLEKFTVFLRVNFTYIYIAGTNHINNVKKNKGLSKSLVNNMDFLVNSM